jgi:hypothetical protein
MVVRSAPALGGQLFTGSNARSASGCHPRQWWVLQRACGRATRDGQGRPSALSCVRSSVARADACTSPARWNRPLAIGATAMSASSHGRANPSDPRSQLRRAHVLALPRPTAVPPATVDERAVASLRRSRHTRASVRSATPAGRTGGAPLLGLVPAQTSVRLSHRPAHARLQARSEAKRQMRLLMRIRAASLPPASGPSGRGPATSSTLAIPRGDERMQYISEHLIGHLRGLADPGAHR